MPESGSSANPGIPFLCSLPFLNHTHTKTLLIVLQKHQCGYRQSNMKGTDLQKMPLINYMRSLIAGLPPSNKRSKQLLSRSLFEPPKNKSYWLTNFHYINLISRKGIGIDEQSCNMWSLSGRYRDKYLPSEYRRSCRGSSQHH